MISTAKASYGNQAENCEFRVRDCRFLSDDDAVAAGEGTWDKVFSNAALHWILRDPSTRSGVFGNVFTALKRNGAFVFEMGGKGNVAEVHTAVLAALVAGGVGIEQAREAFQWFFPSEGWMRTVLEEAGFVVEKLESEYRPTRLTEKTVDGSGGLEGWIRLMCAAPLELLEGAKRNAAVKLACEMLNGVLTREEDGSQWIGYVRLRALARKP